MQISTASAHTWRQRTSLSPVRERNAISRNSALCLPIGAIGRNGAEDRDGGGSGRGGTRACCGNGSHIAPDTTERPCTLRWAAASAACIVAVQTGPAGNARVLARLRCKQRRRAGARCSAGLFGRAQEQSDRRHRSGCAHPRSPGRRRQGPKQRARALDHCRRLHVHAERFQSGFSTCGRAHPMGLLAHAAPADRAGRRQQAA